MIPKFRAWDRIQNKMIDVDEIHFDNGQLDFIGDAITFMRTVDEIELMQSTGLKDKNGKEIFEGDIVSIDTDEFDLLFVKYEVGIYCLMDDEGCAEYLSDYYNSVSVVGNIYESQEIFGDSE